MHRILPFILILAFGSAQAQMETIMDNTGHISGFGGAYLGFGVIAKDVSFFHGAGGGIMVGSFFLGGFIETSYSSIQLNEADYSTKMDCIGIWSGYSLNTQKMIHPYISLKGGYSTMTNQERGHSDNRYLDHVFILHPEAGVEFNISRVFRVVFTVGYWQALYTDDEPLHLRDKDFGGPSGCLTLRLGGFGPRPTKEPPTPDVQSR
ncbi:MAG: hypothetical protein K9I85_05430 [Saprospiraceae bacterium]|nr:hypothetical protein [Saprospiraceae bacterium]